MVSQAHGVSWLLLELAYVLEDVDDHQLKSAPASTTWTRHELCRGVSEERGDIDAGRGLWLKPTLAFA